MFDLISQYLAEHTNPLFWKDLATEDFLKACGAEADGDDVRALMCLTDSAKQQTPWGLWALRAMKEVDPGQQVAEYRILIRHALSEIDKETLFSTRTPKVHEKDLLFYLFDLCTTRELCEVAVKALERETVFTPFVFDLLERMKIEDDSGVYSMRSLRSLVSQSFALYNTMSTKHRPEPIPLDWIFSGSLNQNKVNHNNVFVTSWEHVADMASTHSCAREALEKFFNLEDRPIDSVNTIVGTLLNKNQKEKDFLLNIVRKDIEKNSQRAEFWIPYFLKMQMYEDNQDLSKKVISFCDDESLGKTIEEIFSITGNFFTSTDDMVAGEFLTFANLLCGVMPASHHKKILTSSMQILMMDNLNLKKVFDQMHLTAELATNHAFSEKPRRSEKQKKL